ncbi:MAG: DUF4976 domain-containing protein, partial [Verrucomicrobiales bacterium]|nr:DUF4976 domain-containing protein [Verrucomicrobiales bacterium]
TGFDHWDILPGQGSYYNPDFINAGGKYQVTGYCSEIITEKATDWLRKREDKDKPFILMVQHKAPHRAWDPAPQYLTLFDDITIPEPDTLFDNYEGRGTAAREQDMTIEKTMTMGRDLKVKELDDTGDFKRRGYGRMTTEQKAAWDAAYQPKNDALMKAKLKGKDLIRWKYQRYAKDYLRCVRSVDDSIGALQNFLKQNDLADNTVFIYSSDQGFYIGEHGWFDKRFMYDESYRTPLLVKWPGKVKPGSVNDDLVSNLDFAGTFLDIAGVQVPADMQGESLVPIMKGTTPSDWRKTHYYHYYEYPGWHMVQRHEGVYDGRYKLMNFYDVKEWELYDLQSDPKEMRNVYQSPEHTEIVKRLHRELDRLRAKYEVPPNALKDLSNVDMFFHSDSIRERGIAREKKLQEKEPRR